MGDAAVDEREPGDCVVDGKNLFVENETYDPRVSEQWDWPSVV